MTEAPRSAPTRRGDLVVVSRTVRDYVIGEPSSVRCHVEVGVATSITRTGIVKTMLTSYGSTARVQGAGSQVLVASQAGLRVDELLAAISERRWAHNPEAPKYHFDSLQEAREFIGLYRRPALAA